MRRRYQEHQQRQQSSVRRMIVVFLAGVLTGMYVGLRLTLIALWRSESEAFQHRISLFNKRWTNRLAMSALRGGQPHSPYAVIHHIGRRSGQAYTTPVITARTPEGFIIPLAYGQKVDWYRNICAAGGCTIEWQGQSYRVGAPAPIAAAQAIPAFPRLWGLELRLYGITHFLQLPIITSVTPEQMGAAPAAATPVMQRG